MCKEDDWYEKYINKKNKNKLKKHISNDVNFMSRFIFKEIVNNNLIDDNCCIISISDTVNECNEIKELIGGYYNSLCIYMKTMLKAILMKYIKSSLILLLII